jgi:hypothetical protein
MVESSLLKAERLTASSGAKLNTRESHVRSYRIELHIFNSHFLSFLIDGLADTRATHAQHGGDPGEGYKARAARSEARF